MYVRMHLCILLPSGRNGLNARIRESAHQPPVEFSFRFRYLSLNACSHGNELFTFRRCHCFCFTANNFVVVAAVVSVLFVIRRERTAVSASSVFSSSFPRIHIHICMYLHLLFAHCLLFLLLLCLLLALQLLCFYKLLRKYLKHQMSEQDVAAAMRENPNEGRRQAARGDGAGYTCSHGGRMLHSTVST